MWVADDSWCQAKGIERKMYPPNYNLNLIFVMLVIIPINDNKSLLAKIISDAWRVWGSAANILTLGVILK